MSVSNVLGKMRRAAGWTFVVLVVALVGAYLALLAVNGDDRPPSQTARELAAVFEARPDVADGRNAYVYALGFAAPRDMEVRRVGRERAEWIRRLREDLSLSRGTDPYPGRLGDVWMPADTEFFRECPSEREQRECFMTLMSSGESLDGWLDEQRWVLERYEALLSHERWRAVTTLDHRVLAYGDYSGLDSARRVWFLEAWRRAREGEAAAVREMLAADLEFWRLVLADADVLVSKLIAAAHVRTHFAYANLLMRALPADLEARAVPAAWREPVSTRERSFRRTFAFELRHIEGFIERLQSPEDPLAAWIDVESERTERPSFLKTLNDSLASRLIQPQDVVNESAAVLDAAASASEAPYSRIPEAIEQARGVAERATGTNGLLDRLYNPIGDSLRGAGDDLYARYLARVADLEGVRRAALLTTELRGRGIAPDAVPAALEAAELVNPYTENAFVWDAERGEIVFNGLSPRFGGRHAFWY